MTYCVALRLDQGLLFMSDTRTNAGVDNISTFKKMFTWSVEGDRVITIMTAGNLATTQAVISLLDERSVVPADRKQTLLAAPTMFQVARLVGDTLKEVIHSQAEGQQESESTFSATMIVGGQIRGMEPRLFLIYPEGNFIEASEETPFFQAGETKYGRPIILRAFDPGMSFEQAIKLLYVSFDSTLKANLAVGMPLDMHAYQIDTFETGILRRIAPDDSYFKVISSGWGEALKEAFDKLPNFEF
tara:strand:+ start:240483 stop:241214 length:732 start_codon:yes stop_codon:yes gene_type:complete